MILNLKEGDTIDAYNDGKVTESRKVVVKIERIVGRVDVCKKYWRKWIATVKKDAREHVIEHLAAAYDTMREDVFGGSCLEARFWDWDTKTFVFGTIVGDAESVKDPLMFAKMKGGRWYAVNWNYMLDPAYKIVPVEGVRSKES